MARSRCINARQSQREDNKRKKTWERPEWTFAKPQPRPEREATCDLACCGHRIPEQVISTNGYHHRCGDAPALGQFETLTLQDPIHDPPHGFQSRNLLIQFLLLTAGEFLHRRGGTTPASKPCRRWRTHPSENRRPALAAEWETLNSITRISPFPTHPRRFRQDADPFPISDGGSG